MYSIKISSKKLLWLFAISKYFLTVIKFKKIELKKEIYF